MVFNVVMGIHIDWAGRAGLVILAWRADKPAMGNQTGSGCVCVCLASVLVIRFCVDVHGLIYSAVDGSKWQCVNSDI